MTFKEFENLKPGTLVVYCQRYVDKEPNKYLHQTCKGLVVELDHYEKCENYYGQEEEGWICKQPFVESDFRLFVRQPQVISLYKGSK